MDRPPYPAPFRPRCFWAAGAIATFLVAMASAPAAGQESLLWGALKPGPHAVGYHQSYLLDYTRHYDPEFTADAARPAAHRPRPILVCAWYPARKTDAAPMEYRQYLDVSSNDAQLAEFVRRLKYNVRSVVCEETVGKSPANLKLAEAAAFDRLLATRTFAVKDAPAADGRFPVVIYHPGLNGSHEDNSALFEYLASHGYVVLSSAYPNADAYSVKCGGEMYSSFRDMEFLVRHARGLPFADADRLGAMGHSYGGWAIIGWAAEPGSPLRALVTLDSGLEYDTVESMGDRWFPHHMKENNQGIRAASLRVASREKNANFDHLDPYLQFTPRYEATVAGLNHNDYLTHGAIGPALLPQKWPDPQAARRRSYDRVCEHVLHFLDATLKDRPEARGALEGSIRGEGLDDDFKLQFKPAALRPPTARQLSQYAKQHGAEKAIELMRALGDKTGRSASAATDVLLKDGDAGTALLVLGAVEKDNSNELWFYVRLGQARNLTGDQEGALAAYRRAAELLPDLEKTAGPQPIWKYYIEQGLKELGESEPPKQD